jgi:excisionase family DNA binding protein
VKIQKFYGLVEVAEILHRSIDATRDLISNRKIAHYRIGGRIMVSKPDLEAYLDRQRVAAYGEKAPNKAAILKQGAILL